MKAICCVPTGSGNSMSRFVTDVFGDPFFAEIARSFGAVEPNATLPIDISEDERAMYVRASLPGVKKEQVEVEVHDGVLSVGATVEAAREESGEKYLRRERRVGTVRRSFTLPPEVADSEAEAELKDGVLTVRLPKSERSMPRKLNVR